MVKKSATAWIFWYVEALICLCHASSADVFCEKIFSFTKGRKVNLHRIDTMATVGYYISKLSKTCVFIIGCHYMENMGNVEIARRLNRLQNTRNYNSFRVDDIHRENLKKLSKKLDKAGLIRRD